MAQMFDSIQDSFRYKPKVFFKLDARNAFVTNSFTKMNGVKIGLSFKNTTRVGIGYSWMKQFELKDSTDVNVQFGYVAPFIEYNFYKSKRWNGEIPVQLGIGKSRYKNVETKTVYYSAWMIVYEPAMTFEYRFLKYFGVGAGAGYRFVIKMNKEIKEKFASPIYILRFKIYFGDIYKEHLKKEEST